MTALSTFICNIFLCSWPYNSTLPQLPNHRRIKLTLCLFKTKIYCHLTSSEQSQSLYQSKNVLRNLWQSHIFLYRKIVFVCLFHFVKVLSMQRVFSINGARVLLNAIKMQKQWTRMLELGMWLRDRMSSMVEAVGSNLKVASRRGGKERKNQEPCELSFIPPGITGNRYIGNQVTWFNPCSTPVAIQRWQKMWSSVKFQCYTDKRQRCVIAQFSQMVLFLVKLYWGLKYHKPRITDVILKIKKIKVPVMEVRTSYYEVFFCLMMYFLGWAVPHGCWELNLILWNIRKHSQLLTYLPRLKSFGDGD